MAMVKTRACADCGQHRPVSKHSLPDGQYCCRQCRRVRRNEQEAQRAAQRLTPDELTARREAKVAARRTTTERGLGNAHQRAVDELRQHHVDGSPCDWCGRPMWLDRRRNWDYRPDGPRTSGVLQGDHILPRAQGGVLPDRLLHRACNGQRGEGVNDHLAWVNHRTPAPGVVVANHG